MERNPDTNKSQRELFILWGFQCFKCRCFQENQEKGNYTSEDIYEKADSERDFRCKM
jgi:hypothetical protein